MQDAVLGRVRVVSRVDSSSFVEKSGSEKACDTVWD